MIYKIYPLLVFLLLSFGKDSKSTPEIKKEATKSIAKVETLTVEAKIEGVYHALNSNNYKLPELKTFTEALKGFYLLKEKGVVQKDILTLIDFSLSSNTKRLWVIDLATNTILFQSLVAHGRNTGKNLHLISQTIILLLKVVLAFMLQAKHIRENMELLFV